MKQLATFLIILSPIFASAQFGVNFHQSNLPFVGFNYEIVDRFKPELRLGVDRYLEDLFFEGVVTYDILNKEDYEFYGGLGFTGSEEYDGGVVVPLGVCIYPFSEKHFGFHIEVAPILNEDPILRGSWGIRYRFGKSD